MNIDETLAYIHTTDWRGTKPGLTRIRALLDRLGNPERQLKFVHVTGTNGKGSTCAMLASILHEAGLRTGLYTSPYIVRFNERIQVDGEQIPDDALCALTEEVRAQADAMPDHPSEFELVTAIAMLWFLRSRCDIVVCEVGMGGEFDATNVIPAPEAAVFTNIGLDHMQYLGGTVEEISATKAGILKPGCDAVLYPSGAAAENVIAARCRALGVPLHRVDFSSLRLTAASLQRQIFSFGARSMLRLPLLGGFQLRNAAVALTVVDVLRGRGWNIPEPAVRAGLARVRWPGRLEVVRREPLFLMDGGHNPQCVQALAENLRTYLPSRPLTVLTGVLADKDWQHMFAPLAPLAEGFVTVTPDKGYALETLTVTDKNGSTLDLTDRGNGKYTFTMPSSPVTVAATFMDDNTMLNFFVDVPAGAYYYDAVLWAAEGGIVTGTDAVHFSPDASCTRAQVVTMLYRFAKAQGMDTTQGGMAIREFDDFDAVPAYALEAMDWAVNAGVLKGDNNRLLPQDNCTRAQIVTMLYRALGEK